MFIDNVLADNNIANILGSEQVANILPLVIMFLGFYFFIIRPQSKRQKDHNNMISSLNKGDKVVTNSGIIGTILKVDEKNSIFHLEIAENVKIRVLKNAVSQIFEEDKNQQDKAQQN